MTRDPEIAVALETPVGTAAPVLPASYAARAVPVALPHPYSLQASERGAYRASDHVFMVPPHPLLDPEIVRLPCRTPSVG